MNNDNRTRCNNNTFSLGQFDAFEYLICPHSALIAAASPVNN